MINDIYLVIRNKESCIKILLLFLILPLSEVYVVSSSFDDALFVINAAEAICADTYIELIDAENSGLNTSTLIDDFNYALFLLDEAKIFYQNNLYNVSILRAEYCINLCEQIVDELEALKLSINSNNSIGANRIIQFKLILIIFSVILSYVIWRIIKKYYYTSVMNMKPVVKNS